MDFQVDTVEPVDTDTEEGRKFRQEVRDFLDKELTPDVLRGILEQRERYYDSNPVAREFYRKLGAEGWTAPLAPLWPEEYGGRGLRSIHNLIWGQEEAKYRTPVNIFGIGLGMLAPTLMTYGTDEQKSKHLERMARGLLEVYTKALSC